MASRTLLRYPNKSHRKVILLPDESDKLSEFLGIMMGDGGIDNEWQAKITLNSITDAEYINYVSALGKELFDISPSITKRKEKNASVVTFNSTSLVDFLISKGLPRGNKLKAGLFIPEWILSNQSYTKSCIRGLVDTDGCLYIHKHAVAGKNYENIGFCFTSYSPILIRQVGRVFEQFDLIPHIDSKGTSIYLYKQETIADYLNVFGTSNNRLQAVYTKWRGG